MSAELAIPKEMRGVILSELARIEETEGVRILFAVESGSRAWGFASPDSDYDIRFVYARRPEWYLRLDDPRDVIEWKLDDTLDISGWDVQKALRLMRDSNPSLLEWLASSIFYRALSDVRIADLASRSFNPIKSCHHYLSMARGNMREHLEGSTVKLKKYFYVVRPILATRHVLARCSQPPMLFEELVDEYLEEEIAAIVNELLDMKRGSDETLCIPRRKELDDWILRSLDELEALARGLPRAERPSWDEYNKLFIDLIGFHDAG